MQKQQKDFRFGKRAAHYDKGFEGKASRRFYRLLLNKVKVTPGCSVLDVGCGTGAFLRLLSDQCAIEGHGIDVEEKMIAQAKTQCPEMDISVSPCEKTSFSSDSFDILLACMAFHHFSDKKGFAREASRIIKPAGCLYIADPRFPAIMNGAFNCIAKWFHISGWFGTGKQIASFFEDEGFDMVDYARDGYAQVVVLKKRRDKTPV